MLNISQNMIMLRRPWDTTRPSALPSPPGVGQQSPFKPAHWGLPQSQTLQQRQHPSDAIPSKAEGYNFVDAQSSSRFLKTETRHNDCFQKQFLLVGTLSHWPLHITHAFIFIKDCLFLSPSTSFHSHIVSHPRSENLWVSYCYRQPLLHFSAQRQVVAHFLGHPARPLLARQRMWMWTWCGCNILQDWTGILHIPPAPCSGLPAKGGMECVNTTFPRWFTNSTLIVDFESVRSKKP